MPAQPPKPIQAPTSAEHSPLYKALAERLAGRIDSASLCLTALPDCPGTELYLLDANYPQWQLSQSQAAELMDEPPYWSFCWASGQTLAGFLKRHSDWVKDKSVGDFGAGSGVVAIAAMQAGARSAIACDSDPDARQAAALNAAHNGVELSTVADYRALEQLDVITVADVFYDRDNLPLLSELQARCKTLIVADSRLGGADLPGMRVIERLQSHTVPDLDESSEFRNITLYVSASASS